MAIIPTTVSLHEDLEIPVAIRAWHSNVQIVRVRFYVDYYASTAKGPKGLLNPTLVLEESSNAFDSHLGRDILTRPWRKHLTVTVPLRDFARQELLGKGLLVGKLDVTLNYAVAGRYGAGTRLTHMTHVVRSVPFQMTVVE